MDASTLGDIPAVYRVPAPAIHEMPVIGVYIDPRVRTGFRYKIRPMQVRRDIRLNFCPLQVIASVGDSSLLVEFK